MIVLHPKTRIPCRKLGHRIPGETENWEDESFTLDNLRLSGSGNKLNLLQTNLKSICPYWNFIEFFRSNSLVLVRTRADLCGCWHGSKQPTNPQPFTGDFQEHKCSFKISVLLIAPTFQDMMNGSMLVVSPDIVPWQGRFMSPFNLPSELGGPNTVASFGPVSGETLLSKINFSSLTDYCQSQKYAHK